MSIKFYTANRVKIKDLNDFLEDQTKQVLNQTAVKIHEYMGRLKIDLVVQWLEEEEMNITSDIFIPWLYQKFTEKLLLPAYRSLQPSPFDLSSFLWIYIEGNYAYILYSYPRCVSTTIPDYVQDFSYWNNTDRPERITVAEWGKRRRKWNSVLDTHPLRFDIVGSDYADWEIYDKIKEIINEKSGR